MFDSQNGKCAICDKEPNKLVVDHCHDSGKIRGLLCHSCNRSISIFERADILNRAMKYLLKR